MTQLCIKSVTKRYAEDIVAIDNLTLCVEAGELVALLGPSGCGKTTLLRLIAGLEQLDSGTIHFEDHNLAGRPVHERRFGFMFQDFALFPHRTVGENIAFGLKMAGQSQAVTAGRVEEMLALVNLSGYSHRSVLQLSGGERQRVALARSLAPRPQLLMLDEPLGSLDRSLRDQLVDEVRTILVESGVTALYVTHDQEEAFAVSDRVAVMNRGKIVQDGSPMSVYSRPQDTFVARFLGFKNLLPAFVSADEPEVIRTPIGQINKWTEEQELAPGNYVLLLRPDGAYLTAKPDQSFAPGIHYCAAMDSSETASIILAGQLTKQWYHGDRYRVELSVPVFNQESEPRRAGEAISEMHGRRQEAPMELQFELMVLQATTNHWYRSPANLPPVGTEIYLRLHPAQIVLLPPV